MRVALLLLPFCRWGKLRPREGERLARSAGKFVPEPALDLNKALFSLPRAEVRGVEICSEIFPGSMVRKMQCPSCLPGLGGGTS